MRLERLYSSSPQPIQSLLVAAYGYVLRHRRLGGSFHKYLDSLKQQEALPPEAIAAYQQSRLQAIVAHAFVHVPYYRDLSNRLRLQPGDVTLENMHETLPILEKDEVRKDPSYFVSTATSNGLLHIETSGTTGSPLKITATRDVLRKNYAFFHRFLEWHGVSFQSRSATFAGRPLVSPDRKKPPFWRPNPAFNNLQFSSYHLSHSNLPAYVDKLQRWQPEYIDAYPSSISVIARHILRTGQTDIIRPKVIFTSSETLSAADREVIEMAFQCPVRNQYGAAEMAAFIGECEAGQLHVAPDYGVVEFIPVPESSTQPEFEILATGFINPTMPLLRYKTGDRAALPNKTRCSCGRAFPVVSEILGRSDDVLLTPDGTPIGRLDPVFKGSAGILESQIVQVDLNHVIVKAVLAQDESSERLQPMLEALRARLPRSMTISVQVVDTIPRSKNGKLRAVVSMVKNSQSSSVLRHPE